MAQTSKKITSSRNRVYGTVENQHGVLVLDSDFIRDQIQTTVDYNEPKNRLFEAFRTMFENPKIVWVRSKEDYLQFAEDCWNSLNLSSK